MGFAVASGWLMMMEVEEEEEEEEEEEQGRGGIFEMPIKGASISGSLVWPA